MAPPSAAPRQSAILFSLLGGAAACLAAATLAHVLIDVLGDIALAHDTYDDVAHGSRFLSVLVAIALAAASAGCALWKAYVVGRGDRFRSERSRAPRRLRSHLAFATFVTLGAFVALVAMERFDAIVQGGRIDDVADLLGGSVPFALAILVPTACLVARLATVALDAVQRSCARIVALVVSALVLATRLRTRLHAERARPSADRAAQLIKLLARSTARRAPPISVLA